MICPKIYDLLSVSKVIGANKSHLRVWKKLNHMSPSIRTAKDEGFLKVVGLPKISFEIS